MGKINILDGSVFNRIAAGEVVERPSSVLKELLDNSIDAEASEIEINVLEGGIKKIEVIDNGCGIEFEDLNKVFLAHATSKIKTVDDLEKISTLGFRGEALASIGAVSEVTLISKTKESEFGGKVEINGGIEEKINEYGAKNGTTVAVQNLFYNIPARAKFLKKPRQEANEITNLVERYILANPNIKIKYVLDEKEVYYSTGKDLFEAIYIIYGKQTTENIEKVEYESENGIKVSGFIGYPTFSKPNRTYQTLTINHRYVMSSIVSLCVYNAYEHYLMKGQFPFFVINIDMPLDTLDVNVHPSKMEVKFENSNNIYGIVYQAIVSSLNSASDKIIDVKRKIYNYDELDTKGVSFSEEKNEVNTAQTVEIKTTSIDKTKNFKSDNQTIKESEIKENEKAKNLKFYESLSNNKETAFKQGNGIFSNIFKSFDSIKNNEDLEQKNGEDEQINVDTINQSLFSKSQVINANETLNSSLFDNTCSYKYIGTLFNIFLIIESGENAYFIDQHAAHERLRFDELKKQVNESSVKIQMLIIPYLFTANVMEKQFILDNIENLRTLGFEICEFGNNTFKVSSIPQTMFGMNIKEFFDGILKDLTVFKNIKQADLILDKLMQHSCKTAVRAGDKLTNNEIEKLIDRMEKSDMQLQCPHGRPVIIKIKKKELEKWFKRIV